MIELNRNQDSRRRRRGVRLLVKIVDVWAPVVTHVLQHGVESGAASTMKQGPLVSGVAARVRQPPQVPRGLSPWPLLAERRQGAAPCIS